jgi:hypothetical protein
MSAYQPIQIKLGLQSLADNQADIEATYIDQLVILQTGQSIWLWQGPEHALAWYVQKSDQQLQLTTQAPAWRDTQQINYDCLDEVAFFGHGLDQHTWLAGVDRILPGQWYEYALSDCQWQNSLAIDEPEAFELLPLPTRDILQRQVTPGDDAAMAESSLHEQLPDCARLALAPITTTLLPQLALSLEASDQHHCLLQLDNSSRTALGIDCRIGDWFAMFKGERKRLKQQIKGCYQRLAEHQPGADKSTLDQIAWQYHGWPQVQHQLRSIAQAQGKVLSFSYVANAPSLFHFRSQSRPLNNLLEGFQRLYFYACQPLRQLGFFLPPLMSKALIKPFLNQTILERQSLPLMMLTLDFLLRFHPSAQLNNKHQPKHNGEHHD